MDALIDFFENTQAALYEGVMQPLAFALGLGNRLEDLFDATGWLLVGLIPNRRDARRDWTVATLAPS
jgi:hypothetical protein